MPTDPIENLPGFPVSIPIPVFWGDQDAFRHVNNIVYLRWFESARVAYSSRVGLFDRMETENIGPILASSRCEYRSPLTYPDSVLAGAKVIRIGRSSLTFEHRIVSRISGIVAAEGQAVLVLRDYGRGESIPIPDTIRESIESLERKSR
ncbi:acyl-CoA thioesterase [Tundrisphaera lichenicola]|uniref:acyl-CoA thioesterase n=1 Tax=Tundrisphaera lichenicola TaxID=2029860 RepID=UPI003EBCC82C